MCQLVCNCSVTVCWLYCSAEKSVRVVVAFGSCDYGLDSTLTEPINQPINSQPINSQSLTNQSTQPSSSNRVVFGWLVGGEMPNILRNILRGEQRRGEERRVNLFGSLTRWERPEDIKAGLRGKINIKANKKHK